MRRGGRILLSTIATAGYLHLTLERGLATSRSVRHENKTTSYNKCLQDVTYTELPALISKLNEDPESNALRQVKTNTTTTINHKGLDMAVFRGKRVALMGDSTLYYLAKWMYPLLTSLGDEAALPSYENQTLKDAASLVYERTAKLGAQHPAEKFTPPRVIKDSNDGTWVQWMGFSGPARDNDMDAKLNSMFETAKQMTPDIIIANMGFHWLHLCPQLCPFSGKIVRMSKSAIMLWLDYKARWLERIHNLALISNTSLLLYKTANFVCDAKRYGEYAGLAPLYTKSDIQTLENCMNTIQQHVKDSLNATHVHRYCELASLTERGSQYLNEQITEFVDELMLMGNVEAPDSSSLAVGTFDDHSVQGCWSTRDGFHHAYEAMLLRLRLLTNTIESYNRCR
mmetsp:Transcript_43470/g.74186  ORF Transcript_43470/g.74186 Transcript_43470/m.74186 type:complete len:398 (+) Transcript_43470:97-1290(+)